MAAGGLGTATNLDETQVYARDDLRGEGQPEPDEPASPELVPAPAPRPVAPRPQPLTPVAQAAPMPQALQPRPARRNVHPLAAIGLVVLVAAAALFVGVSLGNKIGSQPPSAGASPAIGATPPAPGPTETKKDHGKGNGNGNGNN